MDADILSRRETHFALWRAPSDAAPRVIVGRLVPGAPITFEELGRFDLAAADGLPGLWLVAAADCGLTDGAVYHYWFEVPDAGGAAGSRVAVTDPFALAVDWRLCAPSADGAPDRSGYPAAVVRYVGGRLVGSDPGLDAADDGAAPPEALAEQPPNEKLVLYELPTAWARLGTAGEREIGVGSFCDVLALVARGAAGADFADLSVTDPNRAYLRELGVNGLELLPPADSAYARQWGYGTTNFLAPDYELGFPSDYSWPTPNRDLHTLGRACRVRGVRLFADVVMAFAQAHPYLAIAPDDFFIVDPAETPDDPDAWNSRQGGERQIRNGYGSTLFRYARFVDGYDPVSGEVRTFCPARQLMKVALLRWMRDFGLGGLRLDSVENVASWDFVREYRDLGHDAARAQSADADPPFLVVGEELQEPLDLVRERRLDGLWNERFKRYLRAALLGETAEGQPDFARTVRAAIDCRELGYADLAQAVLYVTSHDVEGYRNERLCNFLRSNGVADVGRRARLAFACLLTAVGVPMILAGEEFADEHDLFDAQGHVTQGGGKQVDPVNFSRLDDPWRRDLKDYVARLVALRTSSDALAVNDTAFIHVDVASDRRVIAWRRGRADSDDVVVVVANFSDFQSSGGASAEYRVSNWPATPPGRRWHEVTQQRDVPDAWVGREPLFAWEAKVYTAV